MSIEISILVVIAFAFGWYLGSQVTAYLLSLSFRQILNDLGVKNEQLLKLAQDIDPDFSAVNASTDSGEGLTPLEVTIEQHQGVLYAYRKDNKQFLGQGTDREGLIDSISKRMDNVRLIIDNADGADLLRKNNT